MATARRCASRCARLRHDRRRLDRQRRPARRRQGRRHQRPVLRRGSRLADAVPTSAGSATFRTRGRGLRFTWTIPEDLDVMGPAALRLFIEAHGCKDVSLFAGLRKFREGREHTFEGSFGFAGDMVTVGWQRATFRDLDPHLSSPHQPVHTYRAPQPLQAHEIVDVQIALLPHATRLRAGDQLRLDIAGRWLQPRNPVTGQFPTGYARSPRGRCTVHTGPDHPAHLLIGTRVTR